MNLSEKCPRIRYPFGEESGKFNCSNHSFMLLYSNTTSEDFSEFIEDIVKNQKMKVVEQNRIGDNLFVTLRDADGVVYTSYTAYSSSVRLIFDSPDTVLPPLESEGFEKITDSTLCIMSLDYSHRDITDGNGMSYVIILEDGSYIIYDGGYSQDTDRLYAFLKDNCRRKDGKIVIAAWVLTHSHGDHYGNFKCFTAKYANQVTVEYFIANPLPEDGITESKRYDSFLVSELPSYISQYQGARYITMHTGQRMAIRNAVLEVYLSYEALFPNPIQWMNEASLVTKLHIAGQTILFLADAEILPDKILPKMYGASLKSDIFQVAHHGYSGGNEELFRCISPKVAMWTTSQVAFDIRISDAWPRSQNRFLVQNMHLDRAFVADTNCKLLTLPYHNEEPAYYEFG